jgi:hypothetical protein
MLASAAISATFLLFAALLEGFFLLLSDPDPSLKNFFPF